VVGCMACANLCQDHATNFPPLDGLWKCFRDDHIWKGVKEAMIAAVKLPSE